MVMNYYYLFIQFSGRPGVGGWGEGCGRTRCIMVYVKIVKKRSGEET